eukprot:scaffold7200_cov90-Skeletonema_marinoi.AAC.1
MSRPLLGIRAEKDQNVLRGVPQLYPRGEREFFVTTTTSSSHRRLRRAIRRDNIVCAGMAVDPPAPVNAEERLVA